MKKILTLSLAVMLTSQNVFAAELCSEAKIKLLEDQKFIEKFLDQYKLDECRSIQIFKRRSSNWTASPTSKSTKRNKPQTVNSLPILDCTATTAKTQ
ncbi:MAG: hypothetical protein R2877_06795 [Bdellovibrionota bacterium]